MRVEVYHTKSKRRLLWTALSHYCECFCMMNSVNNLFKKTIFFRSEEFAWASTKHWAVNRVAFILVTLICMKLIIQKTTSKAKPSMKSILVMSEKQKSERIFKFILLRRFSKRKNCKVNSETSILMISHASQLFLTLNSREIYRKAWKLWRRTMLKISICFFHTGISSMFNRNSIEKNAPFLNIPPGAIPTKSCMKNSIFSPLSAIHHFSFSQCPWENPVILDCRKNLSFVSVINWWSEINSQTPWGRAWICFFRV